MNIPIGLSEVTSQWLEAVLQTTDKFHDVEIESVTCANIGEGTGIFGEIGLLTISYTNDTDLPASMVVKLPCSEPENLAVAQALGIYAREVSFYRSVGESATLRIPECFYSQLDDDGKFVLLIEDLSVDFYVGDQVVGATHEQVKCAIHALGEFHAQWWESSDLESLSWLPVPNDPAYMATVPQIYRAGLPVLDEEWADRVLPESIEVARLLEPRFEEIMEMFAERPHTFAHADTRLDNLFFSRDNSAEVAFIDFQLCLKGKGINDLAYIIGNSVPREIAAANWESYIKQWITCLSTHGIEYRLEDAIRDYQQAVLYYTVGAMSLIASFDTGNERGAAMAEAYVTRIFNHVVDTKARVILE